MDADKRAECEALWREWCRSQPLEPLPDMGEDTDIMEYHDHVARFIDGRRLREANHLLRAVGALFRENGALLDVHFPPIDDALERCRAAERAKQGTSS